MTLWGNLTEVTCWKTNMKMLKFIVGVFFLYFLAPTIQFTIEWEGNSGLPSLETAVHINSNSFQFPGFQKPTHFDFTFIVFFWQSPQVKLFIHNSFLPLESAIHRIYMLKFRILSCL